MSESAFGIVHKSFVPSSATSAARSRTPLRSGYVKAINLTEAEKGRIKTSVSRKRRMRGILGTKVQGV